MVGWTDPDAWQLPSKPPAESFHTTHHEPEPTLEEVPSAKPRRPRRTRVAEALQRMARTRGPFRTPANLRSCFRAALFTARSLPTLDEPPQAEPEPMPTPATRPLKAPEMKAPEKRIAPRPAAKTPAPTPPRPASMPKAPLPPRTPHTPKAPLERLATPPPMPALPLPEALAATPVTPSRLPALEHFPTRAKAEINHNVYSADGNMWFEGARGTLSGVWGESTSPRPADMSTRPASASKPEDDEFEFVEHLPRPPSVAPSEEIERLLGMEARLGEMMDSIKSQQQGRKKDLLHSRSLDTLRPLAESADDADLFAGHDLAAQWLTDDERAADARLAARRQQASRGSARPPQRSAREAAMEELRVLRARELSAKNAAAFVESMLSTDAGFRPASTSAAALPPSASLPALLPRRPG